MTSLRSLFSTRTPRDRIFISYRRSDTEGYAGRLGDTLKAHFGEWRVFRDVGGIRAGEDFEQKIEASIEEAGALIVLIGPNWLVSNADGSPRLYESGDYVAGEIAAALKMNRLVLPVLVGGASMPAEEQLPEELHPLVKRNATTITDESWVEDVTRLAKVLSFDVSGPLSERRLGWLKVCAFGVLVAAMVFTLIQFSLAAFTTTCLVSAEHPTLYPPLLADSVCNGDPHSLRCVLLELVKCEAGSPPKAFSKAMASVNPFAVAVVIAMLLATMSWVDPARRKYIWAAVVLGGLGTSFTYVFYLTTSDIHPVGARMAAFAATSVVSAGMLALMGLSGFKPNESVR